MFHELPQYLIFIPVFVVASFDSVKWFLQSAVAVLFIIHLFHLQAVGKILKLGVGILFNGELCVGDGFVEIGTHIR